MTLPPKSLWIPALLVFAFLCWMYGGDLADAYRLQHAQVAAMSQPPHIFFAAGVLLFALGAATVFIQGVLQKRPADYRGYRLLPIVGVIALFADLFVLHGQAQFEAPALQMARAAAELAQAASNDEGHAVLADPERLQAVVREFGAPSYLVQGKPVDGYRVVVREDCTGPATEVGDAPVGALLYCLEGGRARAWVTAVGLPDGVRFGEATVIPGVLTEAVAGSEPEPEPQPEPRQPPPLPEQAAGNPPDGGR